MNVLCVFMWRVWCVFVCVCVPYLCSGVVGNEVRCGLERYLVHWPVVVVGQVRRENTDPHLTLTLHEEVRGKGKVGVSRKWKGKGSPLLMDPSLTYCRPHPPLG